MLRPRPGGYRDSCSNHARGLLTRGLAQHQAENDAAMTPTGGYGPEDGCP